MPERMPAPAPGDETLHGRVHAALRAVGEGDTDPGTGSDYGDQTAAVLAELAPELARTPLICTDERHQAKVAALEAEVARLNALIEAQREVIERQAREALSREPEPRQPRQRRNPAEGSTQ